MKKDSKELNRIQSELYKFMEVAHDNIYYKNQYDLVYNLCEFVKAIGSHFDDDIVKDAVKASSEECKKFLLEDYDGDEE